MSTRPPRKRAPATPPVEPAHAGGGQGAQGAPDQFTICTRLCGARCCRYITVTIPAPRSEPDWDEVRWWLAHEGTLVTQDHEGWMLHVRTPCTNLRPDSSCGVYPDHMLCCQEYDPSDCEYTGDVPFDVVLESEADLGAYLERRRLTRGRRVAQSIRQAAKRRASGPPLVPLVGLSPLAETPKGGRDR